MEFDETFKVLMVGDSGVGKSSILMRSTDDVFEPMQPTIGVDFKVKTFNMDNRRVKMTIWDTYVVCRCAELAIRIKSHPIIRYNTM